MKNKQAQNFQNTCTTNNLFKEKIKIENIEWSLKSKTVPYKPGARYCDTCLQEKTFIALANPFEILNSTQCASLQATAKKPFWVELGHILLTVAVLCFGTGKFFWMQN